MILVVSPTIGKSCNQEIGDIREALGQMKADIDILKNKVNMKEEEAIMEIQKRIRDDQEVEKITIKRKFELLMENIEDLRAENHALKMKVENRNCDFTSLETSVAEVKKTGGLPYVMTCAYLNEWSTSDATITYDSIFSDYKNNGGDGDMNIHTGVYTVINPEGYYQVTYSGYTYVEAGTSVNLYLYHNGINIPESNWYTKNENSGVIRDTGSRTLTIHLKPGDTLEIRTTGCSGYIEYFMFCITLIGWD